MTVVASGWTNMTAVERLRGKTAAASLRELLDQSLTRLAARKAAAEAGTRTDADGEEWKDLYEPVFLAREIWQRTGLTEDKQRLDAIVDDYNARFSCTSCTSARVCRCTFRGDGGPVARTDSYEDDYRAGAEFAKRQQQEKTMQRSPEYLSAKRFALAYLLPPEGRAATAEEQARFDAASADYDRQHDFRTSQRQLRTRKPAVRTDAKRPFDNPKKKRDEDGREEANPVAAAKRRADNRMQNAWREPLDKEGQRQVELARLGNIDPSDEIA